MGPYELQNVVLEYYRYHGSRESMGSAQANKCWEEWRTEQSGRDWRRDGRTALGQLRLAIAPTYTRREANALYLHVGT